MNRREEKKRLHDGNNRGGGVRWLTGLQIRFLGGELIRCQQATEFFAVAVHRTKHLHVVAEQFGDGWCFGSCLRTDEEVWVSVAQIFMEATSQRDATSSV